MERLRFALLFDGTSLERWHLRCLDRLEEVAELAGLIVAPRCSETARASRAVGWYARRVDTSSDVTASLAGVRRLAPEDVASLDFVLQLGRVEAPEAAASARRGLWQFEHEAAGEVLPFFREVCSGDAVTRAALVARQRGEDVLLDEGHFRTDGRSYLASRERVLDAISAWPARACSRPDGAERRDRRPQPPPSRRLRLLPLVARTARTRLLIAWQRLFRHPQWSIGVVDGPVSELLAPGAYAARDVEWLPLETRAGFVADPFGLARNGTLHVLCEYFDYRASKGHVCVVEYARGGFAAPSPPVLEQPGHASYPYLVEEPGGIFCVPETADAGEVALYRAEEFPARWTKVAVLLEDFPGVDPTPFRHDGRWWLACTRKGPQEDAELWLWHAAELAGPWSPHARNPVKTDVRGARPGGTPFVHDGVLHRPAQDCSTAYGGRIVVQRVTRLTPTEFAEEPVATLETRGGPFPSGPHTLAVVGDKVLVDGRRAVFVPAALGAFLGILARRGARSG